VQGSIDKLRGSLLERMHWVNADEPEECVWGFIDSVGMLGQAAPGYEIMPAGFGYFFAFGVFVGFVGCYGKPCHFAFIIKAAYFRCVSQIANQLNFVLQCVHNGSVFTCL